MILSPSAQAFLIDMGTGSDGIDSMSTVFMMEAWGVSPEDVLMELTSLQLIMSLHEPDGQEIICLTNQGLHFLKDLSEKIANHAWFRKI